MKKLITIILAIFMTFFTPLDLTVKDLSGDEINEFYTYLRNAGLKGSTGQRYHGVLHKAFKAKKYANIFG